MEAVAWQFVLHTDGAREAWTWRRARTDGSLIEVSCDPHPNYGRVVNDAIRHGFRPKHEPWMVINGNSVTHFLPDRKPPRPRKPKPPARPAPRARRSGKGKTTHE